MGERTTYLPPEALGLTEEMLQESSVTSSSEWEHYTPEFVGTKVQSLDLSATFRQIYSAQKLFQEARISQPEGIIKFKTNLPFEIVFIGDVHLGSIYTDHRAFMATIDRIRKTPNAYIALMSNLIDNGIPSQFPDTMLSNAIPPDKQVVAMRKIVQELDQEGKIIAAVTSPCHEGWTYKKTGQDINALMFGFEGRHFPVLENGGLVHLRCNKVNYTIALYHQVGPYESNFNETHALRQLNRLDLQMKADVVAGGHKHNATAQLVYEGRGKDRKIVAYIRTGTFKGTGVINDQWSIGRYGSTGEPSGESVILWPNQRRMEAHLDFETGILAQECHYLREYNQEKANGE